MKHFSIITGLILWCCLLASTGCDNAKDNAAIRDASSDSDTDSDTDANSDADTDSDSNSEASSDDSADTDSEAYYCSDECNHFTQEECQQHKDTCWEIFLQRYDPDKKCVGELSFVVCRSLPMGGNGASFFAKDPDGNTYWSSSDSIGNCLPEAWEKIPTLTGEDLWNWESCP